MEKRKQFFLRNFVQSPIQVETVVDDDGTLVGYTKGKELYRLQKDDRFFNTLEEAKQYQNDNRPTKEDILKVIKYIVDIKDYKSGHMGHTIYESLCKNVTGPVKEILDICFDENPSYYLSVNPFDSKEYYLNMQLATRGFISVSGIQFRTNEVSRVEWSKKEAIIVLNDGKKLKTGTQLEFQFVQLLLGPHAGNPSQCNCGYYDEDD